MSQPDINHHSRPSSLRHQSIDDVKNTAKRYATYELNWRDDHDYNSINSIDDDHSQNNDTSTNSAQVARWSLPPKTPPPTIPLPPVPQDQLQYNDRYKHTSHHSRKSISPIAINTTRRPDPRDKRNSEPQSPFGGITVTTVKVVEILHSPTDENKPNNKSRQKNFRPEPLNLSAADPVGIITSEHKRRNHVSSLPPPPSTPRSPPQKHDAKKFRISEDPKILLNQQKKRSSIINPQKIRSNKRKGMDLNGKKPEMIIPKEMAFIDARLLAHNSLNSLIRTPTTNRNRKQIRKGGGSVYKKRAPPPKNFELGPTSNPIYSNDPTDMEADLPPMKNQMYPWLPGSHKPPKLLHASLVPLPHRVNPNQDITTKNNDISNNDSKINNNNVSRILSSVNPKRKSKVLSSNYNRLSRVNSQRKRRASIISQDPNRASLVFRRQILEESLMMSFSGMMGGVGGVGIHQPQPLTPIPKPPIRRKTKKVSAKVEDRETRRERRRKEKLEKKLKDAQNNDASNNNDDKSNVINDQIEGIENKNGEEKISESLEVNRIIEQSKVEKEIYIGPQPPPRKSSKDATVVDDHSPPSQKSKNNNSTLSLFASPPERKLVNSSSNSSLEPSTDEPPPFPAHLARSTSFFEHNSSEKSKRKQQPPYPLGPTPSSSISNHSRLMPSPLEGNELFNEEEPKHDSEETNSIQQPTSPLKSPKIGMGILGFFNKQTTKDSTSPPLSQISSPILHTQLPPQSPTTPASLTLSTARTPPPTPTSSIHNPPLSPPLSPRALRLPQQLSRVGRSRRGAETVPNSPSAVQDPEKLRKMEQFEALIASSETSSSKKPITGKIKAFTTAITTAASTATSSASSSIMTSNAGFEKRKKSTDATPYNTPRHSSEASFISANQKSRNSSSNNSLADSIYYKPEETSGKPGDDGVIRVTLTPAVCR